MSEDDRFLVKFWGVRGSIATPGPDTARYGGNTTCVEVRCGQHLLIFDAGTGLRPLGEALRPELPVDADLFLTHTHYDHVGGLPFFGPAYDSRNRFIMWEGHLGPEMTLQSVLRQLMSAPLFPVPLNLIESSCRFRKFACGDTLIPRPGVVLHTRPLNHPNGCVGYRLEYAGKVFAIVTDTEHKAGETDANVLFLMQDADLVIYDATYSDAEYATHKGWGHSTWEEACRLGTLAQVKRLALFHHDPSHTDTMLDDVQARAAAAYPGTVVAREGSVHLL